MHSLQALALMQEKRIASDGSLLMRSQRKPSSTDWPSSNGTSKFSHRPASRSVPRQILSVATWLGTWLAAWLGTWLMTEDWIEHDLFRNPVPTADQIRGRLFRDHAP